MVNSLKLFFKTVEGLRSKPDEIERPLREHRLPHVLSKEHVKRLLEKTVNSKHRTMLSLIYACGLRRGELLALRLSDIDGKRKGSCGYELERAKKTESFRSALSP